MANFDPYAPVARRAKAKRSSWDDEIQSDLAVSRKCDQGKWVECAICVDKNGKHSVIQSDAPFGVKKWKRHVNGACHLKNAGLAPAPLEPAEPRPSMAALLLPIPTPAAGNGCPGLYAGDQKYLQLMVQYGDIKSDKIEIVASANGLAAYAKTCSKAAYTGAPRKKTSKHQMKTACIACYDLAGDERDSFCKRVDNMERVDMVLDAMLSNHKGPLARKVIVDFTKSNTKANPNWNYLLEKAKLFKAAMNY
ncbi:hypothetical protein ACHHYP_05932 [Achlya hypogyna]|uniref:Uncharacterized protein n=1 Tax=Achlya hypogyna TaxID=1202772 RepID=A0A1V9YVV4_ACHHY|nr:hypothetical protein ACHHYP_05932 [Achlya hypogyna]